jgi:plasmid maintenance system antidote protein VapI
MAMNTPVHPGAIVREDCLRPLGLSVTEGARCLGIGRQTLSNGNYIRECRNSV